MHYLEISAADPCLVMSGRMTLAVCPVLRCSDRKYRTNFKNQFKHIHKKIEMCDMTITPLTVCLVIIITRRLLTAVLVHGILTLLLFLYTFCVAFDIVELIDNYNCNLRIIRVSFSFTSTTTSHNSSNTHTKNSDSVAKNKMRSTQKNYCI